MAELATVMPEPMPVLPRTHASTISAAAIDQAIAASATSESLAPAPPEPLRTVDSGTLHETTSAADAVSLPRTTSEEWMAKDADDGAYEMSSQRPRWIVPVIAAGIAAIGVAAVLSLGGNKDSQRVVATNGRLGVEVDSAVLAAVPMDAAEIIGADATVTIVPIDAAQVAVVADAANVTVVGDAATVVASAPVDAAVATKPSKTDTALTTKASEPGAKPPIKPTERTIEELVGASEFAKANTACAANTIFSTPRLVACATAACSTSSLSLATRWIRALPRASRDEMVEKCKSLGVEVAIP